jgi:hypothetical protein
MKKIGFLLFLLTGLTATSQSVLNNYKYVIVPVQFDGFRSENQHQTSTVVKYHLSQNGFNAYYENTLPEEVNMDRCKAARVSLQDQSGAFITRVVLVFTDCRGKELYRTQKGESRIKSYVEAYREAIGQAFNSLNGYSYRYRETADPAPVVIQFRDDVKKWPPAPEPASTSGSEVEDLAQPLPSGQDKEQTTLLPMPVEEMEAVSIADAVAQEKEKEKVTGSLYAQKTETGYQLVDMVPSIRFYLKETSLPNVFLAERKGQNGLLFQVNDRWVFEYYQGPDRMQEELDIRF